MRHGKLTGKDCCYITGEATFDATSLRSEDTSRDLCSWHAAVLGKGDSLALSLSDLNLVWLLLTGCSLMRTAAAETARGNTAVSRNTPLTPHVSISDPEKYALATPPSAADAQHSDCREPAMLCTWQRYARKTGSAMARLS